MCGRVIQSSGPLNFAIVDGMNVRDSRVHKYPPRWNAAPSQELLVIRRNHKSGEVSLDPLRWALIPNWCNDPQGGRKPINAKCETVHTLPSFRDAYRSRRCILPVDGFYEWMAVKGAKAKQPFAIAMKDGNVADHVLICLVFIPKNCPKGDDRGKMYTVTNLRTLKSWTLPNAQHSCGGA